MCKGLRHGHRLWQVAGNRDVLIPEGNKDLKDELMRRAHDGAGHGGVLRTQRRLQEATVYWTGMTEDIQRRCTECVHCQRCKPPALNPALNGITGEMPGERPNGTLPVVIDYLELPQSGRYKYLLAIVSKFTRLCELFPFAKANAVRSCEGLRNWTMAYGVSDVVQFDGGSHFDNAVFHAFFKSNGIRANAGAPYHPQMQGVVERLNRFIVEALRTLRSAKRDDVERAHARAAQQSHLGLPLLAGHVALQGQVQHPPPRHAGCGTGPP